MEDVRCNHAVEAYRLATANHDQGAGHGRKSYGEQRHTVRDRCPCAAEAAAWNRGSAAEFADRALPDISFTNIFGMFSVGKGPFVAQHERIFSTIYKGSTNHLQIEHITLVKPDVAIVDILTVVTGAQHPPPGVPVYRRCVTLAAATGLGAAGGRLVASILSQRRREPSLPAKTVKDGAFNPMTAQIGVSDSLVSNTSAQCLSLALRVDFRMCAVRSLMEEE